MRKFSSGFGVLQGSRVLFSDFADDGPMWTGEGNRECRYIVKFREPFLTPPVVMVGLSMWDTDSANNQRADICAEVITEEGFHIVFRTWGDSRIARVRADWTAFGDIRDDDNWDVP